MGAWLVPPRDLGPQEAPMFHIMRTMVVGDFLIRKSSFTRSARACIAGLLAALAIATGGSSDAVAQAPEVLDPNLGVRTVVSNLAEPTTMAFLGTNDFLILEKSTGRVKR